LERQATAKTKLANHEVVTLAVYLLGGEAKPVDTEDVAKKADEIAPGRFTWRKHQDQINLEMIRVYLSDAKKPAKGALVIGSGNTGWSLSEAGLAFARQHGEPAAGEDHGRSGPLGRDRIKHQRERARLLTSGAYLKISRGQADQISRREAESFFRVDSYVRGDARKRRIASTVNTHGDDPELGPVIRELARMLESEGCDD
jgi:hypothetical protein